MNNDFTKERGFTLVEIMAAIVIVSIVSLSMTAFFVQVLTYSKNNQNKTVMVNVARNALFYMEKLPFDPLEAYFITSGNHEIRSQDCSTENGCAAFSGIARDPASMAAVLNPSINGVQYHVSVVYQKDLHDSMRNDPDQEAIHQYFIPILIIVSSSDSESNMERTELEGYISNEAIR